MIYHIFQLKTHLKFQILECEGPLKPEVVHSTAISNLYPASNVRILGEEDVKLDNFWLAEERKTTGQGFTMKVDSCARMIAGFQIKNLGKGINSHYSTKDFKVSGSKNEGRTWENLLEDQLVDTRSKAASLLNFTFEKPVEIKYLRFQLISYWGNFGGGLQYFAAIPATSKQHQTSKHYQVDLSKTKRWVCS